MKAAVCLRTEGCALHLQKRECENKSAGWFRLFPSDLGNLFPCPRHFPDSTKKNETEGLGRPGLWFFSLPPPSFTAVPHAVCVPAWE